MHSALKNTLLFTLGFVVSNFLVLVDPKHRLSLEVHSEPKSHDGYRHNNSQQMNASSTIRQQKQQQLKFWDDETETTVLAPNCTLPAVATTNRNDNRDMVGLPLCLQRIHRVPTNESILTPFSLRCNQTTESKMVNFFGVVKGQKYEDFLPMYAFFALSTNEDAVVEMVVSDPGAFIERNRNALEWIANKWGIPSSVCVRGFSADHSKRGGPANTLRYLESPVRKAEFTYIGDTDIFLTESVLDPKRFLQMIKFGLPYSNIIRGRGINKLTGLMLVHTEKYYTPQLQDKQGSLSTRCNDEEFLYTLVNESGHGLVPFDSSDPVSRYRPVHGLHLSFNRGPGKGMCLDSKDPNICPMLNTPDLEDFLCNNPFGYLQLSKFFGIMQRQVASNMRMTNGTCSS